MNIIGLRHIELQYKECFLQRPQGKHTGQRSHILYIFLNFNRTFSPLYNIRFIKRLPFLTIVLLCAFILNLEYMRINFASPDFLSFQLSVQGKLSSSCYKHAKPCCWNRKHVSTLPSSVFSECLPF